jgi:hypothetical protein
MHLSIEINILVRRLLTLKECLIHLCFLGLSRSCLFLFLLLWFYLTFITVAVSIIFDLTILILVFFFNLWGVIVSLL